MNTQIRSNMAKLLVSMLLAVGPSATSAADDEIDRSMTADTAFGDDVLLEGLDPEGWHRTGNIEHYNVAALYNKINGRSELYMSYDVLGLSWSTYIHNDDREQFLDLFVYDMQSTTGSFGIYSVEREIGQPSANLGDQSYRTDSNYYFRKGKYYAYVNASQNNEVTEAGGLALATAIAKRLEPSSDPIKGLDQLPRGGIIEDSIQFFKVDAMSLDFMQNTFTAKYKIDGRVVTAFLSEQNSEAEAQSVWNAYTEYIENYGESLEKTSAGGVEIAYGDLGGGYYDAVFAVDKTIAGVSAIKDKALVVQAAKAVLKKVLAR